MDDGVRSLFVHLVLAGWHVYKKKTEIQILI